MPIALTAVVPAGNNGPVDVYASDPLGKSGRSVPRANRALMKQAIPRTRTAGHHAVEFVAWISLAK
jgi:hypothetical protein